MERIGKLIYEHAFENDDGLFLDLEVRLTGVWQRRGKIGEEADWVMVEAVDRDTYYKAYRRHMKAIEAEKFEGVYRHVASAAYRRYTHPDTGLILELDLDASVVVRREYQSGEHCRWEMIEYDWDGDAEEGYEEAVGAAEAAGYLLAGKKNLLEVLEARGVDVPEAYATFLRENRHEAMAQHGLRNVPTFAAEWLWVDLTSLDIPWADENDARFLVISGYLREEADRQVDPHPICLAIDRENGSIVLRGDGETTPLYDDFETLVNALVEA